MCIGFYRSKSVREPLRDCLSDKGSLFASCVRGTEYPTPSDAGYCEAGEAPKHALVVNVLARGYGAARLR